MKRKKDDIIGGNLKVVRNVNRATILKIIREQQPISRVKIANLTGLNKSTVSSVVSELLSDGLIDEEEKRDKNVGRNPINLRLKSGENFVGAINIDSATTRLAIADVDGSIQTQKSISTVLGDPERCVQRCLEELFKLRDDIGIAELKGIGVSIAGIVDPTMAKVVISPNLGWEDFAIGEYMNTRCPEQIRIVVDNDSNSSALAELWFGKHDIELSNFVFLSIGPGIGTGIVVEKKLIVGEFHASGEFGHMTLYEGGQLCSCGNYGCWEAYASDHATVVRYNLMKRFEASKAAQTTMEEIIEAGKAGDPKALDVLKEKGRFLGLGIANIIKAIDPRAVIIGGKSIQAWDMIYTPLMETVTQRSFFGKQRDVKILPTSLQVRPRLLGAATLAIKELFDGYRITR